MPNYISVPFDTDPETLIDDTVAYLQSKVEDWEPADGNLDYWIIQAIASEAAELRDVASSVPETIYRTFGAELMGIVPTEEAFATGHTTWTVIDNKGYTIPDGTQVAIRDATGTMVPFSTFGDTIIAPGSTSTAAGAVLIEALEGGTEANALGSVGGAVDLLDALTFVTAITQTDVTSGGVDEETDTDYLNRLTARLTTMAPRPILPRDFSVLARDIPGVFRAVTIDGYNPANSTYSNERMVAVAAIDLAGANISIPVKAQLQAYLDAMREINFIVNVMDPKRTNISITYNVAPLAQFDPAQVVADTQASVTAFLNPIYWGAEPSLGDMFRWDDTTVVRYNEVVAVLDRTEGVKYVAAVLINGGAVDVNLSAPASLPTLTSVTGTAI